MRAVRIEALSALRAIKLKRQKLTFSAASFCLPVKIGPLGAGFSMTSMSESSSMMNGLAADVGSGAFFAANRRFLAGFPSPTVVAALALTLGASPDPEATGPEGMIARSSSARTLGS